MNKKEKVAVILILIAFVLSLFFLSLPAKSEDVNKQVVLQVVSKWQQDLISTETLACDLCTVLSEAEPHPQSVLEVPRKQPPAIPVNAPMCDKCGKMFLECQCGRIAAVPGAEKLAGEQKRTCEFEDD